MQRALPGLLPPWGGHAACLSKRECGGPHLLGGAVRALGAQPLVVRLMEWGV